MRKKTTVNGTPALPKVIYAEWRNDTGLHGDTFFQADPDGEKLVEIGEEKTVGVYELVGRATVKNATTLELKAAKRG